MDPEIPGAGIYDPYGFGNMSFASAPQGSQGAGASQVPGTTGAPQGYTPSSTPGGVATGSPETHASSGYAGANPPGNLAGTSQFSLANLFGLGGGQAGAMQPGQGMKIAQLGMRMLQPPASPLRQGAPPTTLSTAGQNPQEAQIMRLFGVDAATARMIAQLYGGGSGMTPQQTPQALYGTAQTQPPPTMTQPRNPLQPASAMPTFQNPWAPQAPLANPLQNLPRLGQGAFSGGIPGAMAPSPYV